MLSSYPQSGAKTYVCIIEDEHDRQPDGSSVGAILNNHGYAITNSVFRRKGMFRKQSSMRWTYLPTSRCDHATSTSSFAVGDSTS